jgi:hypothetical protein
MDWLACGATLSRPIIEGGQVDAIKPQANAGRRQCRGARVNTAEVRRIIGKGNSPIVDVRDAPELASGGKLKRKELADAGLETEAA